MTMASDATTPPPDDNTAVGLNITFSLPDDAVNSLGDGFNKYGVREHDDGSIDVIFSAMEPGVRRGVEVTAEFLQSVARHNYDGRLPFQYDHSRSQKANVGWIEPENIKFSNGSLRVMAHIPNTGSQIRTDTINDFTHDPPAINDGSVGFDPRTIEVETPETQNDDPRFIDAKLQEFSLTPFPAGYDDGGLSPNFSERFAVGDRDWEEGSLVQYQANPDMMGMVVTIDTDRKVAMVTLHKEKDGKLVDTGYTVTAGYDDLVAYRGDATPAETTEDSEYSGGTSHLIIL